MSETENAKQTVVRAGGLTKVFRDFWLRPKAKAVDGIDFEINEGEVVGLLGPNGSGKSTTVKMLLGLLYPTAGQLSVLGKSPRDVTVKRQIGYLPEESYLYKYLTAMETLDFFASLFDLSSAERRSRSEQLLDMVGLSHARNRPVGEFSKGMQRRIGMAQAMINDPAFLILDEPTSGLDPLGTQEVKEVIKLLKKRGKTVLVTSHLLSDVEDVCDRVIILYGGKIRAKGTLSELLQVPESSVIKTPALSPDVTKRVVAILRDNLAGEEFEVSHPKKSLETFFLEVIAKAKEEHIETDGVTSGGQIAEYLTADVDDRETVLDELAKPAQEPESTEENEQREAAIAEVKHQQEIDEKLQGLGTVAPDDKSEQVEPVPPAPDEKLAEVLDEADRKLEGLLGSSDKDS